MMRLSKPPEQMKPAYEIVVIGSGYGGGISASRMARAGRDVCLLERGKERWPGEYPDTLDEAGKNMQIHSAEGRVGDKLAMFDMHVHKDINAVVGCGLGGTSLINANVSIEAKPEVFQDSRWPKELRGEMDPLLLKGYERARAMLQPNPYPEDWPKLDKLEAHRESAKQMKRDFYKTDINVHFEDAINPAGVAQKKCTLCGDCVTGCNYGAKNTTLMNYIPDAAANGAEIFTEIEVKYLEKAGDEWLVHYQLVCAGREVFHAPTLFVRAKMVILSAGTLGSSEILMRSKAKGLRTSNQLGKRFSGNGDILGFAYNTDREINGVGWGTNPPGSKANVGPCITSVIDMRDDRNSEHRMILEEGSLPGALAAVLPLGLDTAADAVGKDTDGGVVDAIQEKGRKLASVLRGAYTGATRNTQTYLIMSHDDSGGQLSLENDRLAIHWNNVGEQENILFGNKQMEKATEALGGTWVPNPIWNKAFHNPLVTVHPLGGCHMGDDASGGVVNHKQQVFSDANGSAVYSNLYVADGAVIPTALSCNPLLTISALSERCAALIAQDNGWTIDYDKRNPPLTPEQPKIGISFTETMKGFFSDQIKSIAGIPDFERGFERGKANDTPFEFTLTISSNDLDEMLSNPNHEGQMTGTVLAPSLSPNPLSITQGLFNLFVKVPEEVDTRHMVYRMSMQADDGSRYYFHGYKQVKDNPDPLRIWPDTSTLYISIRKEGEQGELLGCGVLHIQAADFLKQMTTMEVTHAPNVKSRLEALSRFGKFFAGVLWENYGGIFAMPTVFNADAEPRKKRPLRAPAPVIHYFRTDDGLDLRLIRYQGGTKGPVMLVHGAGVSSRIFATDTIDTNLLEYLVGHEYDVWLLDFRVSIDLPSSQALSNGDQVAKYDYPAAIARIRAVTGAASIQAVVHCYGATTFFMSMLAGLEGVRSIVCSQIATHLVVPTATAVKTGLHLPSFLDKLGIKKLDAQVDSHASWYDKLYDKALDAYALVEAQGKCDSATCHRITFMYASLYRHRNLNQLTHDCLHEMFGVSNMETFEHLALLCRKGVLVSATGEDLYMPHMERLKLPILFISGEKNACYLPESTAKTYNALKDRFGTADYERRVIPEYGHIDCIFGKEAAKDVYPYIVQHLNEH